MYHHAKPDKRGRLRAPQPIKRRTLPTGEQIRRGLPAVRKVSKLFLERLGVLPEWEETAKREREKRAAAAALEADFRRQQLARVLNVPTPPKRRPVVDPDVDPEVERNKALIPIMFEVRRAHPDWSGPNQVAEAERIYAARKRGRGPPE